MPENIRQLIERSDKFADHILGLQLSWENRIYLFHFEVALKNAV